MNNYITIQANYCCDSSLYGRWAVHMTDTTEHQSPPPPPADLDKSIPGASCTKGE